MNSNPLAPKLFILLFGVASALLVNGCTLSMLGYARAREASRPDPKEHVFTVQPAPPFLTEELAVAKARECLEREGYKPGQWQLTPTIGPATKARDGRIDEYIQYRGPRSSSEFAQVRFTHEGRYRLYNVRLHKDRVKVLSYGTRRDQESWSSRPKPDPGVGPGKHPSR